ncbi:MAG: SLC13 family permease [Planctomycetaceae bacterium]|nr:SLC13 family permease [Planctomycetaceae bacterium]
MASFAIALTLSVILISIVGIMYFRLPVDITLLAGLTALLIHGAFDPDHGLSVERGLKGFSNPGVLTVAILFVVADGLQRTGAFAWLGMRLLGTPSGLQSAQLRTMIPAAGLSAFLNNTPVVALMMPIVSDWARKHRISVSHLFLPLSYATILGGMCTLIGTSTTVVVNSKLEEQFGHGLSMFELSWVGIPSAVFGVAFIAAFTRKLLPERQPAFTTNDDPREYTVEMEIDPSSPLVGKTIEEAGLRHLPGVYLMEIDRSGHILPAVSSDTLLEASDHLVFVGVVESVVDLQKIPGLKPATDQLFKLDGPRSRRCLMEAVVSSSYPWLRMTVRESRFRSHYNAAIIAVHRNGVRLTGKIGDMRLQPGDTLLLESTSDFIEQQRNSRHFFLVSEVQNSAPVQHDRAWLARLVMFAFIVAASVFGSLKVRDAAFLASLPAAMLMILFRCTRAADARRSIDWNVILVMGAGLGIGEAMAASGTDRMITANMAKIFSSPHAMLIAVYTLSVMLTNMITAKAAAMLVLQIALAAAATMHVDAQPLIIAVIMGAAGSFATPFGYQTNMMVYGPGGYHSSDYLRLGIPLSIIVGVVTVVIAPLAWPF